MTEIILGLVGALTGSGQAKCRKENRETYMVDIIVEIIAALGLVAVAVLQLRSERERKRRKVFDVQNEERRRDELEMSIKQGEVMLASGDLAYVTSLAVTGGHTNGNVEEAQTKFTDAKKEYEALQSRLASKYLRVE